MPTAITNSHLTEQSIMRRSLNHQAACIEDLRMLAKRRIPKFAYEYLTNGCNSNQAVSANRQALDALYLHPRYLTSCETPEISCNLMGQQYAAPFGVAPVGLSGLIWPRASEYQARAAHQANIPFILSSLASISIEQAAENAKDNLWFQLYPPTVDEICEDLLRRTWEAGCRHLVVTIDVPSPGYRPADIRNGLSVPPKISARNLWQSMCCPAWSLNTLRNGVPQFATMEPYLPSDANLADVAHYIRNTLKKVVDLPTLKAIRKMWQGKLIVKGILTADDAKRAIGAGADGLIISNHGGRQLDAAIPSLHALAKIRSSIGSDTSLMVDGGVETGVDLARYLANGANAVFAGRAFMYGMGGLGEAGATHTIEIFQRELQQVMEQLRCPAIADLPRFLK